MKINEIVTEDRKGKLPKTAKEASRGIIRMRDQGGYDRGNHLNRIMMAAACHDGQTENALARDQMDPASWIDKYNTAHPYTKEEHNMMYGALKTVGSESDSPVPYSKSTENKEVHKTSPHRNPGPVALNRKPKK
jgi:hypothetical protein